MSHPQELDSFITKIVEHTPDKKLACEIIAGEMWKLFQSSLMAISLENLAMKKALEELLPEDKRAPLMWYAARTLDDKRHQPGCQSKNDYSPVLSCCVGYVLGRVTNKLAEEVKKGYYTQDGRWQSFANIILEEYIDALKNSYENGSTSL